MVDFLRGILVGRLKFFSLMFSKIKMAFNAVGAWILNVFAAIMRVSFPQLCCKYFTKKGRRNAEKFLPSLEEQKKAFMHILNADIPKRVWSKEFRIWMLQMKEYSLIADCASQEELAEVLFKPCSTAIRSVAVRRCTPTHDMILKFVNETEKFSEVTDLATAVPAAFSSLSAEEILGTGSNERRKLMLATLNKYPGYLTERRDLMLTMANKYPDYVTACLGIILSAPTSTGEDVFDVPLLVGVAIAKKLDLAPLLEQLKAKYPETYATVRENAMNMGTNSVMLVLKGFSLTSWALPAHMGKAYPKLIEDLNTVSVSGSLEDCYDAMAWLSICYQMMDKQDICNMVLKNWEDIKECVSNSVYQQLSQKLVKSFSNAEQGKQVIKLVDEGLKPKAIDRLLDVLSDSSSGCLSDLFPFKEWNAEQQKKAIRLMARGKNLPVKRMKELSKELQELAIEELEIQSELSAFRSNNDAKMNELIMHKLHSRSEVALFCHSGYLVSNYGYRYVQAFQMDESSFGLMVMRTTDDYKTTISGCIEKIIRAHAEKWGLSEQNYRDLLQSPYSSLAALLKESIRKAQDGEPKSSGAVMPNKHGFVAIEET